ncbi:MAG: hypothetical protein ACI4UU_01745 [Clostridia bacterium]
MSVRKLNEIFGYGLFGVGAFKLLLVVLIILQLGTNITAIMNGQNINTNYYTNFSKTIGLAQIILAIGSIIMIFVNIKNTPEVITGYLLGLGALMIEFIIPSFLLIFVAFAQCGMYMKAGAKIKNKNMSYKTEHKTRKKAIKNTEWFYSDREEQKEKSEYIEIQRQKRMAKLEKEIEEWKELLEQGEIDETTYNEETNKLIEKKRKKSERMKRF